METERRKREYRIRRMRGERKIEGEKTIEENKGREIKRMTNDRMRE